MSGISEKSSGAHSALTWPRVYWGLQVLFGARRGHAAFVGDYVRPDRGIRVLDLGCGSGEMVRQMDGADYLGVDRNPRYISAAKSRFGHLGTFRCADLADLELESRSFDVVAAAGVLHHLDDGVAARVFELASRVLTEGGRMVTKDPTLVPGTSRVAGWLIAHDRGRAVRTPDGYADLARASFGQVSVSVGRPRMRSVPVNYPVAMLECGSPL